MIKTLMLLIVLFSFVCLSACINSNDNAEVDLTNQDHEIMDTKNLIVNFILSYDETSKDSNSRTFKIKVSNTKLQLIKEYSGFKAPDNEYDEKEMNMDKVGLVMDFIKENQLNLSLEELKSTDGIGVKGYLRVDVFQPDTTSLLIEGKTNIWGADDYVKKNWGEKFVKTRTNIENIEYFSKAKRFVQFIENL